MGARKVKRSVPIGFVLELAANEAKHNKPFF